MKIKQKREVNYHELIEWVWKNNVYGTFEDPETAVTVYVQDGGAIKLLEGRELPVPNSLFEIEEEIEIDEDTKLNRLIIVNDKNAYNSYDNSSIKARLDSLRHAYNGTKFIYLQNDDGSIGELIWKDGEMVE